MNLLSNLKEKLLDEKEKTAKNKEDKSNSSENLNLQTVHLNTSSSFREEKGFKEKPSSLFKAIEHLKASQIYDIELLDKCHIQYCDDCLNPIPNNPEKSRFDLFFDNKKISQHGIGLSLYFEYMISIVFILILGCLSTFIVSCYFYSIQYHEVNEYCLLSIEHSVEVANLCKDFFDISSISISEYLYHNSKFYYDLSIILNRQVVFFKINNFHYISAALIFLLSACFYIIFINISAELDIQNDTIEDFSLIIGNIPESSKMEDIENTLQVNGVKPILIIPLFKLEKYNILKNEIDDLNRKIKECYRKKKFEYKTTFSKAIPLNQLKRSYFEKIENLRKIEFEFSNNASDLNDFAGKVIAIFNTEKDAVYFKNNTQTLSITRMLHFLSKKNKDMRLDSLHVTNAEEPSDLIWENLEFSYGGKIIRKIVSAFITFLLILLSFIILYVINYLQRHIDSLSLGILTSLIFSLSINITNFIVSKFLFQLATFEKHSSFTRYYFSISQKLTFFTFINTAVIPLTIFYVECSEGIPHDALKNLESNLFMIFFINMVFPIYWLIDPLYYMTLLQRFQIEKHFKEIAFNKGYMEKLNDEENLINDNENQNDSQLITEHDVTSYEYTQEEMNLIFQNPDLELFSKYSYLGKTILISLFLFPFFPLAPIMSGLGIFLLYFIEKYKIITKYRKPEQINGEISIFYSELNSIGILLYLILFFYLTYVMNKSILTTSDIVFSVILIIISIIPFSFFKDKVIAFDDHAHEIPFYNLYFQFGANYEIKNPVTKENGVNRYLGKLVERKIISVNEKEDYVTGKITNISNIVELYYNKTNQLEKTERFKRLSNDKKKMSYLKGFVSKSNMIKIE